MNELYDLIIIGGGPAGVAAGVYASRKLLKTALIAETIGGQSTDSLGVENWIGTVKISGPELAESFKKHLDAYAGDVVTQVIGERVIKLEQKGDHHFRVSTSKGKTCDAKAILIASGAMRRKLDAPGADSLEHKGVTYCASCDGPLFGDMDVAVIGGGNAAFETAAQLLAYAKSVTLITRGPDFKADPVTVKKVLEHPNMRAITNARVTEVKGEQFVSGLTYLDKSTDKSHDLSVSGIFVEIGLIPSTEFAKGIVEMDQVDRIAVDPKNQKTSVKGIWAAGDCTNELYHQNNIAAGDAVKALEDIYMELKAR
jgi:alkyl hydroperoxide reductase subunit F